ncbi:MAG: hypothetical protein ISP49_00585 [Reyranella sp.]|nr:hypothetical protein [Reyranella sp.]MBL6650058.1 hypothetical protein [Reyranella sp.]
MIHPELIPLGVSDPDGRFGAVANRLDIDLIDLLSGARARRLAATGSPLMIDDGRLLGWQSQPAPHRLRLFKATLPPSGPAIGWSPEVELPAWADPHPNANDEFAIRFARDGQVYALFWRARRRYGGGAPPPPELQAEINRQVAAGRIDFDVRTLAVVRQRDDDGFADGAERARRGEDLARHADGMAYRQAGELHNAPWMMPDGPRFLRRTGARLTIVRGDTANAPPVVDIQAEEPEQLVPELSLDGRHLAVVTRLGSALTWTIHSVLTGELVCRVPYSAGLKSFRIFDRRLLYLDENVINRGTTVTTSRVLLARATDSGNLLWSYGFEPIISANRMSLPP